MRRRMLKSKIADDESAELDDHAPMVGHVDTANRPVPPDVAAAATSGPRRDAEVAAGDGPA